MCIICREENSVPCMLAIPCGHKSMCKSCYQTAVKLGHMSGCPNCRQNTTGIKEEFD